MSMPVYFLAFFKFLLHRQTACFGSLCSLIKRVNLLWLCFSM